MSHSLARDAGARAFAAVALVPAIPGKDLLTYQVPETERARVQPGVRVLVPIGRRHETGIVVELSDTPPPGVTTIRAIADVLDDEAILTPDLFALSRWTADYYVTTLADVLAAALPGGLRASTARVARLALPSAEAPPLRGLEAALVSRLATAGPASVRALARTLADRRVDAAVRALAARGVIVVEEQLRAPAAKARLETVLELARPLGDDERRVLEHRAPRQHALYERIAAAPGCRVDASALNRSARSAATGLLRRGTLVSVRRERYRDGATSAPVAPLAPPTLTSAQRLAVDAIAEQTSFQVVLLHGVTGSGKTEVYLQAATRAHARGRSVLFLVPEIALTHQLVTRVRQRFGSGVAVLHSDLGPGERWDEWRRVARGEARIVVGARSAVFAPIANLGLVVVDEEHDAAYKQDEGLRYNARDLAIVRAKLAGVTAILGSATPSVESYQQALDGKYRLLTLPQRVEGRPLPTVEVLDLRTLAPVTPTAPPGPPTRRQRSAAVVHPAVPGQRDDARPSMLLSAPLLAAIGETLARREQVLLFLNRRGFARALQCLGCGEPAGCPSCSVSLTLHERRQVLLCHHCGFARAARSPCSACGRDALRAAVEGTERIEQEVGAYFPSARVGRLDRDTTSSRGAQRRILEAWETGALDILIGTQMVAKGHDVHAVTLVGVLLADVALNLPDFRAAERAFQLLTQVAGRAGRGALAGRVLIQTYRPEHHSLLAATTHDYAAFAPRELALRKELGYPPFSRLVVLRFEGVDAERTERAALELARHARALDGSVAIRGPAPAPLERIRNRYRWQLLLTSRSVQALHRSVRHLLTTWRTTRGARATRLVVDVDPVSML